MKQPKPLVQFIAPITAWCVFSAAVQPVERANAENIEINLPQPNAIEIIVPELPDHWIRLERSHNLTHWTPAADPLFDLTTLTIKSPLPSYAFYRFDSYPAPNPPYIVGVLGDSTAAGVIHGSDVISGGWAEGLRLFAAADTRILNAAEAGLSTKNALGTRRQRLNLLVRTEPKFVFIQFGQIDEFTSSTETKSTTLEEYRENLRTLVGIVREWGGIPILVTPLPWRVFNPDGTISSTLRDRSDVVMEVADNLGTYAVDFHRILSNYYPTLSSEELRSMSAVDQYHFSVEGAEIGAGLLIDNLPNHIQSLLFIRP